MADGGRGARVRDGATIRARWAECVCVCVRARPTARGSVTRLMRKATLQIARRCGAPLDAPLDAPAPAAAQSTTRFCGSLRLTPKYPTLTTMTIDHARCSNEDAAATMPLRRHCAPRPGFAALAALAALHVAALHIDHRGSTRPTLDPGETEPPPSCTRQWRTDPLRLGLAGVKCGARGAAVVDVERSDV